MTKESNPIDLDIVETIAVRMSGTGGQGLILAGRLLAESAVHDGMDILLTNSYGPEARGGASRSEVVIGKGRIDLLHSPKVDVLVTLSQKSCNSYFNDLKDRGLLITDSTNVGVIPTSRAIEVPMTQLALKELGNRMVTNVISLGVLCAVSQVITVDALRAAVEARAPKPYLDLNMKAIDLGVAEGQKALAKVAKIMDASIFDYSSIREGKAPARLRTRKISQRIKR
ncbi:MAG: 2-oxoacid:acceptor oxidoreductase family protein [Planctomycetes bacterium]|nr:2-oxoacid:acceptor oxidoreductase family protein [Planctomycetota bacterium]